MFTCAFEPTALITLPSTKTTPSLMTLSPSMVMTLPPTNAIRPEGLSTTS